MHTETLYLDAPEEAVVGTGAFDRVEIPLVSPQARLVCAMQNEDGILSRQARQIPQEDVAFGLEEVDARQPCPDRTAADRR